MEPQIISNSISSPPLGQAVNATITVLSPPNSDTLTVELARYEVIVRDVTSVVIYLRQFPDLFPALLTACAAARQAFGEEAELDLRIHRDVEIVDEYVLLNVRLSDYGHGNYEKIDSLGDKVAEQTVESLGYFLLTTDFATPGQNQNGV